MQDRSGCPFYFFISFHFILFSSTFPRHRWPVEFISVRYDTNVTTISCSLALSLIDYADFYRSGCWQVVKVEEEEEEEEEASAAFFPAPEMLLLFCRRRSVTFAGKNYRQEALLHPLTSDLEIEDILLASALHFLCAA